jgi:hypothetical protein
VPQARAAHASQRVVGVPRLPGPRPAARSESTAPDLLRHGDQVGEFDLAAGLRDPALYRVEYRTEEGPNFSHRNHAGHLDAPATAVARRVPAFELPGRGSPIRWFLGRCVDEFQTFDLELGFGLVQIGGKFGKDGPLGPIAITAVPPCDPLVDDPRMQPAEPGCQGNRPDLTDGGDKPVLQVRGQPGWTAPASHPSSARAAHDAGGVGGALRDARSRRAHERGKGRHGERISPIEMVYTVNPAAAGPAGPGPAAVRVSRHGDDLVVGRVRALPAATLTRLGRELREHVDLLGPRRLAPTCDPPTDSRGATQAG